VRREKWRRKKCFPKEEIRELVLRQLAKCWLGERKGKRVSLCRKGDVVGREGWRDYLSNKRVRREKKKGDREGASSVEVQTS